MVVMIAAGPAAANHVVMHGGPFAGVVVGLVSHPVEAETLYLAAFGSGIYTSTDGGRRWRMVARGLEDPTVLALVVDPASPKTLYAGTDSGVFVSTDAGAGWRRTSAALAQRNVRSLLLTADGLYAATDRGVVLSRDRGATWEPRDAGIVARDLRVLRRDPARAGRLFVAGFGGVFRSEDGGRSWVSASDGLTDLRVRALALDPTRPDVVYAGTAGGGVFLSTDAGGHWRPFSDGLGNLTVLSLHVTPRGDRYASTVGGVSRMRAGETAWQLVGEDVLTLTVTFVTSDPHRPGVLYAGTGGLLFRSEDHGRHWRELAASVSGPRGTRPASTGGGLRAGAHSHGERR